MKLTIDASSRVGQVRDNNEDMILVGDTLVRDEQYHTETTLNAGDMYCVAVADGMGGHNGGEVASQMVMDDLRRTFSRPWKYMAPNRFNEAACVWLNSVNEEMERRGDKEWNLRLMGTTLVGFVYNHGDCYWMNCGDSRIYLYRDGTLEQLSTDHSYDNMMGRPKQIGALVNCIGGGCTTSYLDLVQITSTLRSGDVLMMCTDGLTDLVEDDDLEAALASNPTADDICQLADDLGGRDNISVCIVKIEND